MKKAYIFCVGGVLYILSGNRGYKHMSTVFGIANEPRKRQEELLIKMFQEALEKYKDKYDLIKITKDRDKKELSSVIEKHIIYLKENFSDNDYKYWERVLETMYDEYFDYNNKDIWEKIELLGNAPAQENKT